MAGVLLREELIPGELIDGVPDKILFGIGAGVLLLVLLAVVLAMRARRRGVAPPADPSIGWGDAPPLPEPAVTEDPAYGAAAFPEPPQAMAPAPTAGPVYYCRCPACQTQFTVNGTKPIVTNCPGCGKKGYLR
jgi:hypothetical protein